MSDMGIRMCIEAVEHAQSHQLPCTPGLLIASRFLQQLSLPDVEYGLYGPELSHAMLEQTMWLSIHAGECTPSLTETQHSDMHLIHADNRRKL